jgi:hypothetical protein
VNERVLASGEVLVVVVVAVGIAPEAFVAFADTEAAARVAGAVGLEEDEAEDVAGDEDAVILYSFYY